MCFACDARAAAIAGLDPCLCGSPATFAAYRRLETDLRRREFMGGVAAVLGMFAGFGLAPREVRAQTPGRPLLLTNLRLFDGTTRALQEGRDILVEGERISALPPVGQGPQDAERIDCGGRSVIPGLIDTHAHATLAGVTELAALAGDVGFVHLVSGQIANAMLMQGFTTIRDVGGPAFGLKLAIDRGLVAGPRIFPSGAMVGQTSGHGDFRFLSDLPRMPTSLPHRTESEGVAVIADGVPEVLRRTREQLMKGASQIKIMAGGGVSSLYDPLDTVQYTADEMRAAVQAAADWGTYVCAHVYTDTGIRRCIETGVKCIEHGQLAGEETVRMISDSGTWWSIQPFLADEDANPKSDPVQRAKQQEVAVGTERAFELARKYPVRMSFGTDTLFNAEGTRKMGRQLNKFSRFMSALDALHLATGAAGDLLALSGPRAPYDGALGVIAPGAFADLLVLDGDLTANLDPIENHATDMRLIMKGGRIFKEQLA
ncbi:MAG: amidohydrolase family protein [Paracoccaceae bacterium]|nr:MAG: amidohydrolase family protein [Paracoccaceae bacterium]